LPVFLPSTPLGRARRFSVWQDVLGWWGRAPPVLIRSGARHMHKGPRAGAGSDTTGFPRRDYDAIRTLPGIGELHRAAIEQHRHRTGLTRCCSTAKPVWLGVVGGRA